MSTPIIREQVRWQDLNVRSELDIVLEIAKKEGWKDCEVFGYGDMITEPQESKGWKLIPADIYKDSIPPDAIARLHLVINAGVRVRGVIIADDDHRTEPTPAAAPTPAKPAVSASLVKTCLSFLGKALLAVLCVACVVALVAGAISLISFLAPAFLHVWPVLIAGLLFILVANAGTGTGTSTSTSTNTSWEYDYDPKLVILVDNGKGGTTWVSLFTWYD